MIYLEYKTSENKSQSISSFLIQSRYSTSPRSHNGSDADGETGEESEGKLTDTPPQSERSTHRGVVAGVETNEVSQAGGSPLCRLSM